MFALAQENNPASHEDEREEEQMQNRQLSPKSYYNGKRKWVVLFAVFCLTLSNGIQRSALSASYQVRSVAEACWPEARKNSLYEMPEVYQDFFCTV